jgi:4-amino-4-deoxy-L-arabinose transferase-like glycosyltransferase
MGEAPAARATRVQRALLVALLVATAVGRVALAVYVYSEQPRHAISGDTRSYVHPAHELVDRHEFDHGPAGSPEFLRTPGYPLFLAALEQVFGRDDLLAVLLAQAALSVAVVAGTFLLGRRLWSATVGLGAAFIVAIDPSQALAAVKVLTESLATLLVVAVALVACVLFGADRPKARWAALLGFAIAASTMVRPVTYYLPLLAVAVFAYRFVREPPARRSMAIALAAFLAPLVVVLGGWQFRNHVEVGSWRLSGVEAKNLYYYRATGVLADTRGIAFADAQAILRARLPHHAHETIGRYYGRMYSAGVNILTAHPWSTLKLTALGLAAEVTGVQLTLHGFALDVLEPVALALLYGFYALVIFGVVKVVQARRTLFAHVFVFGMALYLLAISAGPEAQGGRGERFRAPAIPLLGVYAAIGAVSLWQARPNRAAHV